MAEVRTLRRVAELDELLEASVERPVWLFKHSLTCGVSSGALAEYESFVGARPENDPGVFALVEIQRSRDVSAAVAEKTGVRHQSPQVLLLRDGRAVWNTSHWRIREEALAEAAEG